MKLETIAESTTTLASGARLKSFSSIVKSEQLARKPSAANEANYKLRKRPMMGDIAVVSDASDRCKSGASAALQYPLGVVKKTWAFGHPRTGTDVKLEEVLEPTSLKTAVLSAFQWDTDWVLAKIKTPLRGGETKCVFIMHEKDESKQKNMLSNTEEARAFLRICFPPMDGQIFCMHSKLMLLFHPHKLRIAIPTANLLDFDWGETGQMENSVFMIDLPRLPEGAPKGAECLTPFGKELLYFLEKQEIERDVRDGILNFDYSATQAMAFVHTVGGISFGDEASRTGFPGLSRAVRGLGLQTDDAELDFAASSIGSLDDDYLRPFYAAAKGYDPVEQLAAEASKAKANFFKPASKLASVSVRDKIRIYFPTHETVTASTAGAAGTICIARQYYENMPFPRACFRDHESVRPGLLSHNKLLYARGTRHDESGKQRDVAWAYVGSANMSPSAWGRLVYDKKVKQWKTNCRNWECGVLLPVPVERLQEHRAKNTGQAGNPKVEGEDSETESEDDATEDVDRKLVSMDVFQGLVDVPFEYPGALFNGREPWYFKE